MQNHTIPPMMCYLMSPGTGTIKEKWQSLRNSNDTVHAICRQSRHCRGSLLIVRNGKEWQDFTKLLQTVCLCCGGIRGQADRDPTDFSAPMNQKSYPMNNNQKWLYTSLIKSGSVFTILISNTDAVSYHPFCSSVPVPAGAWLKYPQLQ